MLFRLTRKHEIRCQPGTLLISLIKLGYIIHVCLVAKFVLGIYSSLMPGYVK